MAKSSAADSDTLPEIDWAAFGRAVFSPARPHLAEATSVTREVVGERWRSLRGRSKMSAAARTEALTDPAVVRDVCETIATRLDAEWLFDGGRLFLPYVPINPIAYGMNRLPRPSDTPRQLSEMPYEVELITALAAGDPRDIKTVEALAMEAAHALVPWGVKMPTRVAWVLLSSEWPDQFDVQVHGHIRSFDVWSMASLVATWSLPRSYNESRVRRVLSEMNVIQRGVLSDAASFDLDRRSKEPRVNAVRHAAERAKSWRMWSMHSMYDHFVSDASESFPQNMTGKPLRDIDNPLDAYLRVIGLGYALVDIRGDVMIAGVPCAGDVVSAASYARLRSLQTGRHGDID